MGESEEPGRDGQTSAATSTAGLQRVLCPDGSIVAGLCMQGELCCHLLCWCSLNQLLSA